MPYTVHAITAFALIRDRIINGSKHHRSEQLLMGISHRNFV